MGDTYNIYTYSIIVSHSIEIQFMCVCITACFNVCEITWFLARIPSWAKQIWVFNLKTKQTFKNCGLPLNLAMEHLVVKIVNGTSSVLWMWCSLHAVKQNGRVFVCCTISFVITISLHNQSQCSGWMLLNLSQSSEHSAIS